MDDMHRAWVRDSVGVARRSGGKWPSIGEWHGYSSSRHYSLFNWQTTTENKRQRQPHWTAESSSKLVPPFMSWRGNSFSMNRSDSHAETKGKLSRSYFRSAGKRFSRICRTTREFVSDDYVIVLWVRQLFTRVSDGNFRFVACKYNSFFSTFNSD